jgi:small subunit ribosomal protein S20
MVRTYLKKVEAAIASGDQAAARSALATAIPIIDRMANKGIMHKNKASRHKSRLTQRVNKIGT